MKRIIALFTISMLLISCSGSSTSSSNDADTRDSSLNNETAPKVTGESGFVEIEIDITLPKLEITKEKAIRDKAKRLFQGSKISEADMKKNISALLDDEVNITPENESDIQIETLDEKSSYIAFSATIPMFDDSIQSSKYIFLFLKINTQWDLALVHYGWNCHEGRGHQDFSTEPCN